ncbi:MAG TPA: metalloregulator ArsR/SmtB family transcription factor [Acidobacteriaceae bacterium]|jgi:DNA-binding transcriptional ArsR family regulator|nr:metalloregulator ArsR/SmtB family transcription factor [Acidobacteriaceae bacterium]
MSEARAAGVRRKKAEVFAALGDETRLALVAKLCRGDALSISELTETAAGARMTRQAVTKHLRVLERAGLVRCSQAGRERRFAFRREPVDEMREYLQFVSTEWDEALGRLKALVEE